MHSEAEGAMVDFEKLRGRRVTPSEPAAPIASRKTTSCLQ
jgi:hypothetical protein